MTEYIGEAGVRRFGAHAIDTLIAMLLAIAAMKGVALSTGQGSAAFIFGVVVYLGYYIICEGIWSRTPGKMMLGLIVVTSDGYTIGWSKAIVRTLIRLIEVNPAFFGGAPAGLTIILSHRNQRLGDMAADTVVIREDTSEEGQNESLDDAVRTARFHD
jgi:uncharacterized RDD family membrane protein YckC